MPRLHLASRSPRRRELLEQMGVAYQLMDVEVDEAVLPRENPEAYVERLAREKAVVARARLGNATDTAVLAADTSVVLDGVILGKPRDAADAIDMLESLSHREHQVFTGVALAIAHHGTHGDTRLSALSCSTAVSESRVRFRATTPRERQAYVATGEPLDKAGAYAIQGRAAVFIEHLSGSYSGVMGLPVFETGKLLAAAGFDLWAG